MSAAPPVAWDAATFEGLYRCVHCGLCLNACPTYRELGLESDSPRGRLYLMRALVEGRLELGSGVVTHMDRCLVCRACETACPSGVPFGHLMELTRDQIGRQRPRKGLAALARRMALRSLFPYPGRLRGAAKLLGFYQHGRLQAIVRRFRLLPPKLAELERLLPNVSARPFISPSGGWLRAPGQARYRVGLLSGCIMSVSFADVDRATARVLHRNSCDVFVPASQACCGALHAHDGDREGARALARRNIEAFEQASLDAIVVNAAGCGAMMKGYGELLGDDPALCRRAAALAAKVRDASEFLAGTDFNRALGRLDVTATYQDACHLAHGQGIREAPRTLLRAIPGLRLIEMRDPEACCGSAGIYNIVQPELSRAIGRKKCASVADTGADVVVSANPGCMIQLQAGLREQARLPAVKHLMEVLDEAYRRMDEDGPRPA